MISEKALIISLCIECKKIQCYIPFPPSLSLPFPSHISFYISLQKRILLKPICSRVTVKIVVHSSNLLSSERLDNFIAMPMSFEVIFVFLGYSSYPRFILPRN